MDTRVHCLEFETDVCSEELKYVKEQGDLRVFQARLVTYGQINDIYYQVAEFINPSG